jgi:hypothetical protein
MGKVMQSPDAVPPALGRTFGNDWSIPNVARLLRFNAARGVLRDAGPLTGSLLAVNRDYIRTVSARHLPTHVSVTFTRDQSGNCWHAALCFASMGEPDMDAFLPWDDAIAERWLAALFGEDRPHVREDTKTTSVEAGRPGVRHFKLEAAGGFR